MAHIIRLGVNCYDIANRWNSLPFAVTVLDIVNSNKYRKAKTEAYREGNWSENCNGDFKCTE